MPGFVNGGHLPGSWRRCFEQSFDCRLDHISVTAGVETDRYLEDNGAVAETRDDSTILLSTRLATLPAAVQLVIAGHELAHTVQLSRRGCDSEESLEREAWQATLDAVSGRRHNIRGAASRPLWVKGLIDPKSPGKAALEYYTLFNKEPVDSSNMITISDPEFVSPMSLLSLLKAVESHSKVIKGKDLLLVTHGTSSGLSIQIFDKQKKKFLANTTSLDALMTETAERLARGTGFPEADFQELQTKMKVVQGLGIAGLAFRGCSIGKNTAALKTIRKFFGAKSASAPDLLTNYGWITPVIKPYDKKKWDALIKKFPNKVPIETTDKGEHVAVSVSPATGSTHCLSESLAATKWWMSKYLPGPNASATPYSGGQFPVHSLSTNPVTFPLQSGYAGHIIAV